MYVQRRGGTLHPSGGVGGGDGCICRRRHQGPGRRRVHLSTPTPGTGADDGLSGEGGLLMGYMPGSGPGVGGGGRNRRQATHGPHRVRAWLTVATDAEQRTTNRSRLQTMFIVHHVRLMRLALAPPPHRPAPARLGTELIPGAVGRLSSRSVHGRRRHRLQRVKAYRLIWPGLPDTLATPVTIRQPPGPRWLDRRN